MPEYQPIRTSNVAESPIMERRTNLRLLGYWEKLRGQHIMPVERDIDPDDLQDIWERRLLARPEDIGHKSLVELVGDELSELCGSDGDKMQNIMFGLQDVFESKKPLLGEGEFQNHSNQLVKYRFCLIPFGENNRVNAVFGTISYKIFG